MPTIHVEARVSSEQLLQAVEQMPPDELAAFVARVLALRAEKKAPHLSQTETALLLRINEAIPTDLQQRYNELITKRRAYMLSPKEHEELLHLTDQVEQGEADRVAALADLAQLRRTPLADLMRSLGIQSPPYA